MFRDEIHCRLFQHCREAVISGHTKTSKADKSSTFEIMDEEEFCELEDTVVFFHTQKNIPASRSSINTKWSTTKKVLGLRFQPLNYYAFPLARRRRRKLQR